MMKFEIEKRVEMQDIFFLRKLYAYVHSKEWKMETLDRKKIGMNIKVRRMQKLISQTAMAEKLGISQTHMSNVEVGRAMLSLELLLQLKNILGCTIDELLCLEDENKPRKKRVRVIRYLDKAKQKDFKESGGTNMQSIDLKKIGNEIKVRRVKQGIQQTALAEMLDITQTHLSNIGKWQSPRQFKTAIEAAQYFRVQAGGSGRSGV
mgnify:CR=1 FL=1